MNFGHLHGVYLGGPKSALRLVSLGPSRGTERGTGSGKLLWAAILSVPAGTVWESTDMSGMRQLYRQELVSLAPDGLSGMECQVRGSDYESVKLLDSVLDRLPPAGGRTAPASGGREGRLSLYDPEAGYVWPDQVLALNCLLTMEQGGNVSLPCDAPACLEALAEKVRMPGTPLLFSCPADTSDAHRARRLAANQLWVRDGA